MLKRIISLIILGFISSSCTMAHHTYGKVELTKINDSTEKYGIIVFRAMFFKYDTSAKKFVNDEKSINLTHTNRVDIFAKNPLEDKFFGYKISGDFPYPDEWDKKKDKLILQKGVYGWFESTQEILMPEYFYTIRMLPEGEYYFSHTAFDFHYDRYLEQRYDQKDSPYKFYVQAGKINYLGDLYFMSPERTSFFFSEYNAVIALLSRAPEAKAFMKNYYPEINLPFITNIIKRSGN